MIANHIHDALGQVKKLREIILEKRNFQGYSGTARMAGGLTALAGAVVLASDAVPKSPLSQLIGWCVILVTALVLNYGGLAMWFFFDKEARRELLKLMPAFDAVPALAVGAVLSLAVILQEQYQLLFGIWMCLYGLGHVVYRLSLPKTIYAVGIFYMLCGSYCLLDPGVSFVNPWPMGIVFFLGESVGGFVLYKNREGEGDKAEG